MQRIRINPEQVRQTASQFRQASGESAAIIARPQMAAIAERFELVDGAGL